MKAHALVDLQDLTSLLLRLSYFGEGVVACMYARCRLLRLGLCCVLRFFCAGISFEMPMYRRNVDSFPFRRIWHSADVLFLGEVMPNFSVDIDDVQALTILLLFVPRRRPWSDQL